MILASNRIGDSFDAHTHDWRFFRRSSSTEILNHSGMCSWLAAGFNSCWGCCVVKLSETKPQERKGVGCSLAGETSYVLQHVEQLIGTKPQEREGAGCRLAGETSYMLQHAEELIRKRA